MAKMESEWLEDTLSAPISTKNDLETIQTLKEITSTYQPNHK